MLFTDENENTGVECMYVPSVSDCVPFGKHLYDARLMITGAEYPYTVILTVSVAVRPLESVTVSVYVLEPAESNNEDRAVALAPF